MAADLHIHALVGADENDIAAFSSSTLGSKHFNMRRRVDTDGPEWRRITDTPNVWVGEVSWLKAAIFDDAGSFVPDPVSAVNELIGEDLPTLTPELRDAILAAVAKPVQAAASDYGTTEPDKIAAWLDAQMGQRLFTVSW